MRRRLLLVALGWVVFAVGFASWMAATSAFQLREQLRHSQFWLLEAIFTALVVFTALDLPQCLRTIGARRGEYAAVVLLSLLATGLAGGVAPRTNRIYYDEQIYQGIAQNLSDMHLAQMCNDGSVEYGRLQCWRGEYNKQPYGYPYILSLAYRVAGVGYWTAEYVNVLAAGALVLCVFGAGALLFGDTRSAVAAAAIAALMPEQLLWSNTAAAEPIAALAASLAVLAALYFTVTRTTRALLWTAVATAFAVQFRTESLLVAPTVALILAVRTPRECRTPRVWAAVLLAAVLSSGLAAHLMIVRNESWGATGDRLSLAYVASNLGTNGWFYLADSRFPVVYTLLALIGVCTAPIRASVIALAYFLFFWGMYLLFYAGSYNYGADVRYSLMTFPPLALLAGAGAGAIMRRFEQRGVSRLRAAVAIAAVLAIQFTWYLPLVRAVGEEAWAARADVTYAEQVAKTLRADAIVLTHNPSVFHVLGVNAAQLSLVTTDPGYVKNVLVPRYAGGVYVHWNFWCNVADLTQREFCSRALEAFPHRLASEYRERDYRYAFYQLVPEAVTPSVP